MTLKDISNGPAWVIWIVFFILALLSLVLLTGHGANLIAGYNTASKEEKSKYDEKKLCRVTGAGLSFVAILILIMGVGEEVLPASFADVFGGLTLLDCVVMMILMQTRCRK